MSRPDTYRNHKRGRVTTVFDPASNTGHLYEDTYSSVVDSLSLIKQSDKDGIKKLMLKASRSEEAIDPQNDEEEKLFSVARDVGLRINDGTHQRAFKEFLKVKSGGYQEPEWMLEIGGLPVLPEKFERMKDKIKGFGPDSPVPAFVGAASSYGAHDDRTQTQLKRNGIDGLNYSVALAALKALAIPP